VEGARRSHPRQLAREYRSAGGRPDGKYFKKVKRGMEGLIDMSRLIFSGKAGVFASLRDATLFTQAHLELGVVTWPGEIDLAPDAVYRKIKQHGKLVLE